MLKRGHMFLLWGLCYVAVLITFLFTNWSQMNSRKEKARRTVFLYSGPPHKHFLFARVTNWMYLFDHCNTQNAGPHKVFGWSSRALYYPKLYAILRDLYFWFSKIKKKTHKNQTSVLRELLVFVLLFFYKKEDKFYLP